MSIIKRIEILGLPGAGKTTLTKRLNKYFFNTLYENYKDNIFLDSFLINSDKYAFETEILFLLLHYSNIKNSISTDSEYVLCDYSFTLDYTYCDILLNDLDRNVCFSILDRIFKEIGEPYLIIYLKCSTDTIVQRIKKRNRNNENNIKHEFIQTSINILENKLSQFDNVYYLNYDCYDVDNEKNIKELYNYIMNIY
jgi:Deoxynucleoside kinases